MTEKATKTTSNNKFADLNITKDELARISEAMKKEEFRKLLVEYAEEISDPKNRELYEKEIVQLEQERGVNATFIHPEAGFCLKTTQNGERKCFINICKNSNVDKPTSTIHQAPKDGKSNGRPGLYWQLPHTCSPPREDKDKSGTQACVVYDVVFHPDAYRMGETNQRFNMLLRETAMDTIEKSFRVRLDRPNAKVLKYLNFKGMAKASIVRRDGNNNNNNNNNNDSTDSNNNNNNNSNNASDENDAVGSIVDQLKEQYMKDQLDKRSSQQSASLPPSKQHKPLIETIQQTTTTSKPQSDYTEPNYKMVHRGLTDIQDFANELESANSNVRRVGSTRPNELVVTIELPLCESSNNVDLDIYERSLRLQSEDPKYKLDLNLPYPVNEAESRAKFDKTKRCLIVTLKVVPGSLEYVVDNNMNNTNIVQEAESQEEGDEKVEVDACSNEQAEDQPVKASEQSSQYAEVSNSTEHHSPSTDTQSSAISEIGSRLKEFASVERAALDEDDDQDQDQDQRVNELNSAPTHTTPTQNQQNDADNGSDDVEIAYLLKNSASESAAAASSSTNADGKNDHSDDDDDNDDDDEDEENEGSQQAGSSLTGSSLGSSLNSSSAFNNASGGKCIKGILKKNRSYSESEKHLNSSLNFDSLDRMAGSFGKGGGAGSGESGSRSGSGNSLSEDMSGSKKSVSFNNQVVRNVFKPGSTVNGMKKPNSCKNHKKKNKRKRTVSDPSHDNSVEMREKSSNNGSGSDRDRHDGANTFPLRSRNISESSDDSSMGMTTSNEELNSNNNDDDGNDAEMKHASFDEPSKSASDFNNNSSNSSINSGSGVNGGTKKANKKKNKKKHHSNEVTAVNSNTQQQQQQKPGEIDTNHAPTGQQIKKLGFKNKIIDELDD